MKFLHTADWHLGKRLEQFSRLAEQQQVLAEICAIAEREDPDVILVAGDLYDQINPSVEAAELLYRSLKQLAADGRRAVVGIAGNHDSPDRIEAPDPLARACGIILSGYPHSEVKPFELPTGLAVIRSAPGFVELKLPRHPAPLRLILTPYANELRLRKALSSEDQATELRGVLQDHWAKLAAAYCDGQGVNVLMAHLFLTQPTQAAELEAMEDEGEKSVLTVGGAPHIFPQNLPSGLQYVALGHLHSYIPVQMQPYPVVYSSSPLAYSVDDRQPQKQVVMVEIEPGEPAELRRIPLQSGKPVLRTRCASVEEALGWLATHPDCLVELTVATQEHLSAQDRKRLLDSHDGIVRIVPEFSDEDMQRFTSGKQIDLSQNIETLFAEYFAHKKGLPLNEDLRALFREVLAEEEEDG
jgi:DNA repair protein SbcD/Mre11